MTMIENFYHSTPAYDLRMPEWVHSERYENCEDFYESYTNGKIKNLCGFSFTDKPIKPKKERDRKRYRKANA